MREDEEDGMRLVVAKTVEALPRVPGQLEPEERISRAGGARAASPDGGRGHGFIDGIKDMALTLRERAALWVFLPGSVPALAFVIAVVGVSDERIARMYGATAPVLVRLHGATLCIAALLAALQQLQRFVPRLHRGLGLAYLATMNAGLLVGYYLQLQPIWRGTASRLSVYASGGFIAYGVYLQVTAWLGLYALLVRRDPAAHRRWMTCSTLGTLAGLSLYRLAEVVTLLALGRADLTGPFAHDDGYTPNAANFAHIAGAAASVAATLAVHEVLRRRAAQPGKKSRNRLEAVFAGELALSQNFDGARLRHRFAGVAQ